MAGSMEWLLVVCVCLSVTASALALKAEIEEYDNAASVAMDELEEYDNAASVAMDELEFVDTEHLNYASSQVAPRGQKRRRDGSTINEAALDYAAHRQCNAKIAAAFDNGVLSTDPALICKKIKPTPKIQWCDRVANMYALPVGQGDCTVITCPSSETDSGDIVLVDCGATTSAGDIYSSSKVKEFLQLDEVGRATVVITHGDADHYNYLTEIFDKFKGKLDIIVGNEKEKPENLPNGNLHQVNDGKECIGDCPQFEKPQHLLCGIGGPLNFNILAANVGNTKNQKSIVLKVRYNDGPSLLLPGDMEYAAMRVIADKLSKSEVMNADFYKIAHHGAASTNPEILKKWLAAIVPNKYGELFVSHGFKNKHHHPRCESIGGLMDPYARRCRGFSSESPPLHFHTFQCHQPKSSDYELENIQDRCLFNTFLKQKNGKSIACIIYIAINSGSEEDLTPLIVEVSPDSEERPKKKKRVEVSPTEEVVSDSDSEEVVSPCSCKTQCFCHVEE